MNESRSVDSRQAVTALAGLLRESQFTLVFTGAGISTGSGIPDFRGPDGLWRRYQPVYFQEFLSSSDARKRHWQYKLETWQAFRDARPNAAHRALVALERMNRLHLLVTQNIDGLHQLAGQSPDRLIELHGTNRWIECVQCGHRSEPEPVFQSFAVTGDPPVCGCGGFLKPATISFGQNLPPQLLRKALEAATQATLVLAIGSSLEVEPAASVPRAAAESGATYVIINQGSTAHDALADLKIEGDATAILPACVSLPLSEPRP